MTFLRIIRNVLAVLGVVLIGLVIYTKFISSKDWNHDTGVDIIQHFSKAYISMPDGTVRIVKVRAWRDYEYSDQLQITTTDGITYMTHANRMILTDEK